ncbi:MAG: type III-A CRISPR-associated RAMP protein Csm4 [Lachnospiraceae bacterium]|nr:type III-A CRISPR-associated RAMP protein Csm4 [Lachnospiraceae bacterium]
MKYKIYKFKFNTAVHFGKKTLEDCEYTICADTLFSALCHEAVKNGEEKISELVAMVRDNRVRISDAFPYIGKSFYIPKPMLKIQKELKHGDSEEKKAYKKLTYIPINLFNEYLKGELDVKAEKDKFSKQLGQKMLKVSVSIRGEEKTTPYRVGTYSFKEGSGLYIILAYEDEKDMEIIEEYLIGLSFAGIGGKRNSGLGRFELLPEKNIPDEFVSRLNFSNKGTYMTLSCALPKENELPEIIENANYMLAKRSGFVASDTYSDEQLRKRDLYVMQSGSCFKEKFEGDIYDVSDNGRHAVYRYAKPLFLEVIS